MADEWLTEIITILGNYGPDEQKTFYGLRVGDILPVSAIEQGEKK